MFLGALDSLLSNRDTQGWRYNIHIHTQIHAHTHKHTLTYTYTHSHTHAHAYVHNIIELIDNLDPLFSIVMNRSWRWIVNVKGMKDMKDMSELF